MAMLILVSCVDRTELTVSGEEGEVNLLIRTGDGMTKSESPDEDLVSDMTVFIFNEHGLMDERIYLRSSDLTQNSDGDWCCPVRLLHNCRYSVYVCANTGFEVTCGSLSELMAYRFYMAYPDDYRIGVAMSGSHEEFEYTGQSEILVYLRRVMAKVSVSIDRSALDSGITFLVKSMTVGNCPKSVLMFADNSVTGTDDCYNVGFRRSESGIDMLNTSVSGGVSGEVSLYMLENIQGSPLGDITDYADKVFPEADAHRNQCSYVELSVDYYSDLYESNSYDGLIYRFYLGESPSDFNVERNCHYHITLRPEGDGLSGGDWLVDKSGLDYIGPTSLTMTPCDYMYAFIGQTVDFRVTTVPEDTELEWDIDEFEDSKAEGYYDYYIDDDGRGATFTFKKFGEVIIYVEAGPPINAGEAALVVII
ncbi:MAG: DUF4906 domain-containing protein [Bacteroidales bacterium]|nr:DUF4906 domain-containing protein [Bacteroidales bacterium]